MTNFEKMCMVLFVVILAVNIGLQAFGTAMTETEEMLPEGQFIDYDYTGNFSHLQVDLNNLTNSFASTNAIGTIIYGLSAIGSLAVLVLNGLLNVLTGYFDLSMFFANMIEPATTGAVHVLFGLVGLVMSMMVAYGLFVMVRSILVK